jgi:hypothetical protein
MFGDGAISAFWEDGGSSSSGVLWRRRLASGMAPVAERPRRDFFVIFSFSGVFLLLCWDTCIFSSSLEISVLVLCRYV